MLPASLAESIKKQVRHYLEATFEFSDEETSKAFSRFIEDPENGLFKGPWVSLKRPFRPAAISATPPFDLKVPFHPFQHQALAWERLSGKDKVPQSTIITTGTGSGKTECFLFPILDYCLKAKRSGQKGIKAIILYPMNALASDQETRFAKSVWSDSDLRNAGITVGLYTGRYDPQNPSESMQSGTTMMGEDHGISNQAVQLENPPDILLTNYKMLDFLLMRPKDQKLWRFNTAGVLKYLVLDELHTYDGAQGSDVACLLRRLKERLGVQKGTLCAVGTSATVEDTSKGGGLSSKAALARFASKLFEEEIDTDAIIGEDRLNVEEIVVTSHDNSEDLPSPEESLPIDGEEALVYVRRVALLWGAPDASISRQLNADVSSAIKAKLSLEEQSELAWRIELGIWLKRHRLFRSILEVSAEAESKGEDPLSWLLFLDKLAKHPREFGFAALKSIESRGAVLSSFLALVAEAREVRSSIPFPLIPTQIQLWIRELARLGRVVAAEPSFAWVDEPFPGIRLLPAFHCSECGEAGWISVSDPDEDSRIGAKGVTGFSLIDDPKRIYESYFGFRGVRSPRVVLLSPWGPNDPDPIFREDGQQAMDIIQHYLCPTSLVVREGDGPCPLTGERSLFRVKVNKRVRRKDDGTVVGTQGCPHCGSNEGVFFIGTRSATISSVAINELFGSSLNSDPKLLAFTDSVQDASHRAGFFSARTYNFTLRTALQHFVDNSEKKIVPLKGIGQALLEYWAEKLGGLLLAITILIPPDLREYGPFLAAKEQGGEPSKDFIRTIAERLTWQITEEFSLMQTHGRTMERMGATTLGWKDDIVDSTVAFLSERLPGLDTTLIRSERHLKVWLLGILHRYREKGALYHDYLDALAKRGWWGKSVRGSIPEGREVYPSAGRYKPKLITTGSVSWHENILATTTGTLSPWAIKWTRRALNFSGDEATVIDLLQMLLKAGKESGLLRLVNQDGSREYYALSDEAAVISNSAVPLVCSETKRSIIRPESEAVIWSDSPSMEYYGDTGCYARSEFNQRQLFYQQHYRKGTLRRVVASEHTGLLKTNEREELEKSFKENAVGAPNVLTCTSTLEMGIDIGDLSSTMLCAIPPSTANYLQRIGRAGRSTGTALIISVVNQRPHDLFFFGRPAEMLRGQVRSPGCWLDAAAVLARQYLAFCFDCGSRDKILIDIPRTGRQLVDDLGSRDGNLSKLFDWVARNEDSFHQTFLVRFGDTVQKNTSKRFIQATRTERLLERIREAATEFEQQRRELINARERLQKQLEALDAGDEQAKRDIEREQKILRGRVSSLDKTTALEILTDHGLLPNYAFPERGVRFYGSVYNRFKPKRREDSGDQAVEVVRGAGAALKELAPHNKFYTHNHRFEIQQLSIGSREEPLLEEWAVCGHCGHMRRAEELKKAGSRPGCPQCGRDGVAASQSDQGQVKKFIHFPRSQALSYMEHYNSFLGDNSDERDRQQYQMLKSFDHTDHRGVGAVLDSVLPFGVEYRPSMVMREVNVGYQGRPGAFRFGPGTPVPLEGFKVCEECGVVESPGGQLSKDEHRRSCPGRRRQEKREQAGRSGNDFKFANIYLYRELKSEALRLLLPFADSEDIESLIAAIYLGLRLRFEGNPGHLLISHQQMIDSGSGLEKNYLVILDAVPGGTGYLKALFEERDLSNRPGEGILDILRRAKVALETCDCRRLGSAGRETDGCYRCIRAYHLQYNSEKIGRERAIRTLTRLLESATRLVEIEKLDNVQAESLFTSVLEKRFVERLQRTVEERGGHWDRAIIRGRLGFRFSLAQSAHVWELELQPRLGEGQGVKEQCQPDFLLSVDDNSIRPIAIFTDGKEYHVHPNNRLGDDFKKRRSVLQSGAFWVWNITWEDVTETARGAYSLFENHIAGVATQILRSMISQDRQVPALEKFFGNSFDQLFAFIECPNKTDSPGWAEFIQQLVGHLHSVLAPRRSLTKDSLFTKRDQWKVGNPVTWDGSDGNGEWTANDKLSRDSDILTYARVEDVVGVLRRIDRAVVLGRLPDEIEVVSQTIFTDRWRRFLGLLNLMQFSTSFYFWTTGEAKAGDIIEIPVAKDVELDGVWREIEATVCQKVRLYIRELKSAGVAEPLIEFFNEEVDVDAFAELAWPDAKVALLVGEQSDFASKWQRAGWRVVVLSELQTKGVGIIVDYLRGR